MDRQELIFKTKNRTVMETSMHENFTYHACANVIQDRENAIDGSLENANPRHRIVKNGRILENFIIGEVDFRQHETIGNSSHAEDYVYPMEYHWIYSEDFGFLSYLVQVLDCKRGAN
ncbi:unnamed protein product [Caenorhabditis angaria]|uniref:Uncharacterized protein n=1 Tax=Caenorhabditis angaria TaxID=860376 RepID=A0A9P1MWM5_9PELO|nr:unnamed protein product [Caenorhabditis angaria]